MAYTIKQLDEFSGWLKGLKDGLIRQRLVKRLRKALRPGSEPRFETISRVCAALGVRLVAQPIHPAR